MVDPFTIILIRHAKTWSNVERKYCGWTDDDILQQPLQAVDRHVLKVYGSDLKRCRQTARYYFPNATFHGNEAFRECNFGDFEGKTYEQLKQRQSYKKWLSNPHHCAPPNGETIEQIVRRVNDGLQNIEEDSTIRLVIHGGTMRAILMTYAPTSSDFWSWDISFDNAYILKWPSYESFKEGNRCTSLSVVLLTVKDIT